jgi:hypothetical protein
VGVIEAPRVQLENGLFRTKEKPTSLPTAALEYPRRGNVKSFIQGGSAKGRWRTRKFLIRCRFRKKAPASQGKGDPLKQAGGKVRVPTWVTSRSFLESSSAARAKESKVHAKTREGVCDKRSKLCHRL